MTTAEQIIADCVSANWRDGFDCIAQKVAAALRSAGIDLDYIYVESDISEHASACGEYTVLYEDDSHECDCEAHEDADADCDCDLTQTPLFIRRPLEDR